MNTITPFPFVRHIRTEPTSFTLQYRNGRPARAGRGLAFWFRPLASSIAQVPMDDRELPFLFHGRSADFQDVTAQGVVTLRLVEPELIAERIDFTIDPLTGQYQRAPIEQLASLVTQLAQQLVWEYLSHSPLRTILAEGVEQVRGRIRAGLAAEPELADLGVAVVSVRVSALTPTPELEAALQMPTREAIQQSADEATFQRRAQAVDKERAIEENELQNRIELARRREQLLAQEGANGRLAATERAAAEGIAATAEAERIALLEQARNAAERDRIGIYAELDPAVLLGLAGREFAGKIERIDQLNLTPDLLTGALARMTRAAS